MKNLLKPATALALALALTACNSTPKPPPITPEEPIGTVTGQITADKISGTVSDKLLFGGTVDLVALSSAVLLTEGSIDSRGLVTLPLNVPAPSQEYLRTLPDGSGTCVFTGTASNPTGNIALYPKLLAYDNQGDPVSEIFETLNAGASQPNAAIMRIYADSAQKVQGVIHCSDDPLDLIYNLDLKEGWNAAEFFATNAATTLNTLNKNARSTLTSTRLDAEVGVILDNSPLTLKPGDRLTRKATIYPIGGYSGTVKLSTNVPGLSVEPGSVTIAPPMTAQGIKPQGWAATGPLHALSSGHLSAQSVDTTLTFVAAADAPDFNGTGELRVTGADSKIVGREAMPVNLQQALPQAILTLNSSSVTVMAGDSVTFSGKVRSSKGVLERVFFHLDAEAYGFSLITSDASNVTETGQDVTFTINAYGISPGDKTVMISAGASNGFISPKLPLNVKVLGSGIGLSIGQSIYRVYPNEVIDIPVTVNSVGGYSGMIELTITDLPKGVTTQKKTVFLSNTSVSVNLTLSISSNAPITETSFTVVATTKDVEVRRKELLVVYPPKLEILGTAFNMAFENRQVDNQGNLWIGTSSGSLKISPDLKSLTAHPAPAPCGLSVGADGGIWTTLEPYQAYTRFDPVTLKVETYPSAQGRIRCGGDGFQIDSKKRLWEINSGIYRRDLVSQVSTKMAGADFLGNALITQGSNVWIGNNRIVSEVNGDNLTFKTYDLPDTSLSDNFYPFKDKIYFRYTSELAVFSKLTGSVSRIAIPNTSISRFYGIDDEGNSWVTAYRYNNDSRNVILRLSPSGAVLKELPLLDGFLKVSPTGGLWLVSTDGFKDITRVSYIAP